MKDYERAIDIFANQECKENSRLIEYRLFYDKKKRAVIDIHSHQILLYFTKKGKLQDIINYR